MGELVKTTTTERPANLDSPPQTAVQRHGAAVARVPVAAVQRNGAAAWRPDGGAAWSWRGPGYNAALTVTPSGWWAGIKTYKHVVTLHST